MVSTFMPAENITAAYDDDAAPLTGVAWIDNSFGYDPNITTFTSERVGSLVTLFVVCSLVLFHSWSINWGIAYTNVRLQTELGAIVAICAAVFEIVAVKVLNPWTWRIVYELFSNGLFTMVVQLCDNYMFMDRFCAVVKASRGVRILYHLYIWCVMTLLWIPFFTIVPFFADLNSDGPYNAYVICVTVSSWGAVAYNIFGSYKVVRVLYEVSSRRNKPKDQEIADDPMSSVTEKRHFFIKTIAIKSACHCVTSSMGSLLYLFFPTNIGDPFFIITLVLSMHIWFNMRIELFFTGSYTMLTKGLGSSVGSGPFVGRSDTHNNSSGSCRKRSSRNRCFEAVCFSIGRFLRDIWQLILLEPMGGASDDLYVINPNPNPNSTHNNSNRPRANNDRGGGGGGLNALHRDTHFARVMPLNHQSDIVASVHRGGIWAVVADTNNNNNNNNNNPAPTRNTREGGGGGNSSNNKNNNKNNIRWDGPNNNTAAPPPIAIKTAIGGAASGGGAAAGEEKDAVRAVQIQSRSLRDRARNPHISSSSVKLP